MSRPIQAQIDLGALQANFTHLLALAQGKQLIAVLKADAYGHGAASVAQALSRVGCQRFAVLSVEEALCLRDAGVSQAILVLAGVHSEEEAELAIANGLVVVLHNTEQRDRLESVAKGIVGTVKADRPISVEIEVDTGMHRAGVTLDQAPAFIEQIAASPFLQLQGVFTHAACADAASLDASIEQWKRFSTFLTQQKAPFAPTTWVHAANSAALLAGDALACHLPQANAVRPGIALYGVNPVPERHAALKPVMSLRSQVVQLRELPAGEAVGYGATYRTTAKSWIATVAGGYADGIPWNCGNRGQVLLAGRRVPIVGRVSMDYITLDLGPEPVPLGTPVIVFGNDGAASLEASEFAQMAGSFSYEQLVRIGSRVVRHFVD